MESNKSEYTPITFLDGDGHGQAQAWQGNGSVTKDHPAELRHECMSYIEGQFGFCEQEVCPVTQLREDLRSRQIKEELFLESVIKKGHKCVFVLWSYPISVGWCKKEPCVKNK